MKNFRLVSVCFLSAAFHCIYSQNPFVFEFQQSHSLHEIIVNHEVHFYYIPNIFVLLYTTLIGLQHKNHSAVLSVERIAFLIKDS
jgi:hypothetical protein